MKDLLKFQSNLTVFEKDRKTYVLISLEKKI